MELKQHDFIYLLKIDIQKNSLNVFTTYCQFESQKSKQSTELLKEFTKQMRKIAA